MYLSYNKLPPSDSTDFFDTVIVFSFSFSRDPSLSPSSFPLPALLLLALWKYRVQLWCSQRWQPNMSQEQINSAKPIAYWWLGMYFFLVGGFLAAMILSHYFDFKIPVAAILAFFSLWWIKMDIWWLLLCRNGVRSTV